jgi:gliding motility-associated-like protein
VLTPLEECDDDADGLTEFTLTDKDTEALNGQTGLSVSYYLTQSDAEAGTPEIGPVYTNVTADAQQVWIRLTDTATDCFNTMPLDLVVNPLPVPEPASLDPLCDDDTDGLQTFDLSSVASQVIGSQLDMGVTYHQTQSDADSDINALGDNITTTTPNLQTIFIRLENTVTGCYAVSTIDLVVNSLPLVDLEDNYVICESASGGGLDFAIVDPGLSPANYSFIWRDESGTLISTDPTYTAEDPGIYSLEVSYTDGSGCTAPLEIFTVNESGNPAVTASVTSEPFADTHVIVATASGTGIYEFSLDQGPWQDSGTFIGVSAGEHSVNVRDVNGCGVTTYMLFVIDFPPYFTPNGDGYNDVWNISALSGQMASKIYIFDRYGKLLKQISPAGDGWDGTYNGQMMPTSDYWFLLEYNDFNTGEPKQLRAHFTLKR